MSAEPPPGATPPASAVPDDKQRDDAYNQWVDNELEAEDERLAIQHVEQEQESAPPRPMDWRALEGRTPPARVWWIQDWFGPDPTLCSGSGGMGKSVLWQAIGTSLVTAHPFLGVSARDLRVLMWACEDDADELWRRQAEICTHFGVPLGALADKLTIVPRYGRDNTLLDLVFGKPTFTPEFLLLREQVNDLKADVLVLDNNAHTFGGNESDRHQVTMFVNGMNGMVRGRHFAPVLLGHTSRAAGSEYSGSAAWENACRMRWYMGTTLPDQKPDDDDPPDTGIIYLAKRKANYTEKDYMRLRFRGHLLVPEAPDGRRFDAGQRDDVAEAVVLKAMSKLVAAGIQPSDGKTAGDYLPRQIVAKGLHEGYTGRELAAAMHRLMGAGKLKRAVVGTYANRSPRYGVVPVS